MNLIILRGVNIGNDATKKEVGGKPVIEFSVADNRSYMKKEERIQTTQWFKCSYWSQSNVFDLLKKGTRVNVIGHLATGVYLDQNQKPCADLKVTVTEIDIITAKEDKQQPEPDTSPEAVDNDFPA